MLYIVGMKINSVSSLITGSALILGLAGGVASADRWHGGGGGRVEHREQHWNGGGGGRSWIGGVHVAPAPVRHYESRPVYESRRPVYVERERYVRRPIYVQRPIIREHYYNYYQRPSVIVENYDP